MKKIILLLFGIAAFFVLGLITAPIFLNLSSYKNQLSQSITALTGVKPVIEGKVELRFLPSPVIKVSNVSIPNMPGTMKSSIITIEAIEVDSSLLAFLQGKVTIKQIRLINPVIELERLANGKKNWHMLFKTKPNDPSRAPIPKEIEIQNGYIAYQSESIRSTVDYINALVSIDSLEGPFKIKGKFDAKDNIITVDGAIDKLVSDGQASLTIASDTFNISLLGNYAQKNKKTSIQGQMKTTIPHMNALVNAFFSRTALADINSTESLDISSKFIFDTQTASLEDIVIKSNSINGRANVDMLIGKGEEEGLSWDIDVAIDNVNFDQLVKTETVAQTDQAVNYYTSALRHSGWANYDLDIPKELAMLIKLHVDKITYRNQLTENLSLETDIFGGKALIHQLSANLPGQSQFEFMGIVSHNGIRPLLSGNIKSSGLKFREIATWIYPNLSFIPEDQMNDFLVTSNVIMTPQKINLSEIYMSVDRALLTGDVTILPRTDIPIMQADIKIDQLNADQYHLTHYTYDKVAEFIHTIGKDNVDVSWLKTFNLSASVILAASDVQYNNHKISSLNATMAVSPGIFSLQRLTLSGDKAAFVSRAKMNMLTEPAQLDIELRASGFDTSAFILEKPDTPEVDDTKTKTPPAALPNEQVATANAVPQELLTWQASKEPFTLSGFGRFVGNIDMEFMALKHGDAVFKNVKVKGGITKRILRLSTLTANLGSGTMENSLELSLTSVPSLGISSKLTNVDLATLAKTFHYNTDSQGIVSLASAISTKGKTPYEWTYNAAGKIDFNINNVVVQRFDLHSMIKAANRLYSVIDFQTIANQSLHEGSTVFKTIQGEVVLEKGLAKTQNVNLTSAYSVGRMAGNTNLYSGISNNIVQIIFAPQKDKPINFTMNFKGPINRLERTVDLRNVDNFITNKGSIKQP